jgi:hypothetical protein
MLLRRIEEEGDKSGIKILVNEMAHLPRAREFAAVTDQMARTFRSNRALSEDETLMMHAHKLASMGKRLYKDRQNLKLPLEAVRSVIAEWRAWVENDDPTDEEIQNHLERVAGAMSLLDSAMSEYDELALARVREEMGGG